MSDPVMQDLKKYLNQQEEQDEWDEFIEDNISIEFENIATLLSENPPKKINPVTYRKLMKDIDTYYSKIKMVIRDCYNPDRT